MSKFAHMTIPWSELPIFLAVARGGSLSQAARVLKLDRTTISRRLDGLENKLNHSLFHRDDGNFTLTNYGRQVFVASESAEQALTVLDQAQPKTTHPLGRLRVSMPEHLLITLSQCFKQFTRQHADIMLELTATDQIADLQHFETDIVLRITKASLSKLKTHNIGKPIMSLYQLDGAKDVLNNYISRPHEKTIPKFAKEYLPNAKIIMSVDGLVSMREMILQGVGVGFLPNYFADTDKRLIKYSPPAPAAGFSLQIAYLPEQKQLPRLKLFVDFVEQYLKQLDGFETQR